ncbi:MAG: ATP-binding protein [Kiritimatiellia bacterium]|nr:ATP-binding protein [Kiritimatiellia bacterium]
MKLGIASGKGGTGKTTIAVNMAAVLVRAGTQVEYLDCDVEEPNGHIFLKPKIEFSKPVGIPVPVVDETKCNGCRKCAEICQYHAIMVFKKPLIFPELCHGCGGCALVCPTGAIKEQERPIGVVETGSARGIRFVQGRLNVGEAMSPPLIRAVKQVSAANRLAILDSPPGTSCPMVTTVRNTDYVILVTEPTPFGLNDLKLAVETVHQLNLPFGVIINRADIGNDEVVRYCRDEQIPILMEIADDRCIAGAYSRGIMIVDAFSAIGDMFAVAAKKILKACNYQG